jgi:hypothetical protein
MSDRMANSSLRLISGGHAGRTASANLPAYRSYTRALLRRYFRMAVDIGRLPSILGGLCFRARVSSYRLHTFEDAVIFVHDIERVFERIPRPAMEIIAGVVLLDYSIPEAALRLDITVQRAERRFASAVDSLSAALLDAGLLRPVFESTEDTGEEPESAAPVAPADSMPPKKPPVSVKIEAQAQAHSASAGRIQ